MSTSGYQPHDDEDAAAVLAVLLALQTTPAAAETATAPSIWGDPVHRIGRSRVASATGWWASGMPR